jgi:hypothetical protein
MNPQPPPNPSTSIAPPMVECVKFALIAVGNFLNTVTPALQVLVREWMIQTREEPTAPSTAAPASANMPRPERSERRPQAAENRVPVEH